VEALASWTDLNAIYDGEEEDRARWELDFGSAVLLLKLEGYPLSSKTSIAFGEILLNAMPMEAPDGSVAAAEEAMVEDEPEMLRAEL